LTGFPIIAGKVVDDRNGFEDGFVGRISRGAEYEKQ